MDQFITNMLQAKMDDKSLVEQALAFMGYTPCDQGYVKKFGFSWYVATNKWGKWEIFNYFLGGRDEITGNPKIQCWSSADIYTDVDTLESMAYNVAATEREIHGSVGSRLIEFDFVSPAENEAQRMGLL